MNSLPSASRPLTNDKLTSFGCWSPNQYGVVIEPPTVIFQKQKPASNHHLEENGSALIRQVPITSNESTPTTATTVNCICERPSTLIVCQRCGSELFGRVQLTCPAHSKRLGLMDQRECNQSFCRSVHLTEVNLLSK